MAVFPQGNPGAVPLDSTTPVGQFRLIFGDTQSTPYDPDVPGQADYGYFSDAEITALLAQGGGSENRAIGFAYLKLSGSAAMQAKTVKDFDLSVDLTKRSGELAKIAQLWFERADAIDDAGGENDFFDVVGFDDDDELIPEGMIPEYGRAYVHSRTTHTPGTSTGTLIDGGTIGG